ncbi:MULTISPECIES: PQQ-binding-like beta-propeller repeat protein [unclassified Haladaptatus]|uniref:outer membrane protein assembly factor BamB family protein n=1 Tax=unclassified Haladaptatus TaxID=2622732 RepID=UPI00209C2707|nr:MULTISPECIES: PQQ-binding-like beta-propeller repeat protein [unclassified Haladaptatus]MCO8242827.1 PQQ-binding-like beta-propeller repeat protein [Haladaptatus sp. AB643]MCO8252587.1 PQQ-binding-like beta-propeller repeat protein [Haladaptatus sp. AB618]
MNPSPSSLSRRGFLATAGTLGTAVGLGDAQTTTTTIGTTTSSKDAPKPDWTFPENPDDSSSDDEEAVRFVYPIAEKDGLLVVLSAYLSGNRKGSRYSLQALNADDGSVKWSNDDFFPVTLPVVEDGTVYLSAQLERGDGSSRRFVALDLRTGDEQWHNSVSAASSMVKVDDSHVYLFAEQDARFVALDTSSGKQAWTYEVTGDYASEIFLLDGTVYFRVKSGLYALSAEDGSEQWKQQNSNINLSSVTEEGIFCRRGGSFVAFDRKNGDELWSVQGSGTATVEDGRVYLWGETLRAIDPENGSVEWQYDDVHSITSDPVVADGLVVGVSGDGVLSAINTDGTKAWTFETETQADYYSTVSEVSDGKVYSMIGQTLYVLSAEDGSLKWSFSAARRGMHMLVTYDNVFFGTYDGLYTFERHHSLLDTAVDGTSEFLTSAPGLGLSGILVGTAAFAAYRRFNDDDDSTAAAVESAAEPELEYGRLERLSADEFTETYRVRKRTDDGPKLVAERQLAEPRVAGTFRSAVERWAELNDRPGVVPVLEIDGDSIELPYYEDGSLADSDRPFPERLDALSAASTVVHDAHTDGVIHGGLTPASVFLDGDDAFVADWELGSELVEFRDSADPSPYDAPEQVAGTEADERTDVYRLGAIAAFVLTGKSPDEGSLRALDPEHREVMLAQAGPQEFELLRDDPVSEDLYEIISKAMAEDPADRYESVVAFDDMLRWAAFRA